MWSSAARGDSSSSSRTDEFSVMVLASDLGIDARPCLIKYEQETEENWHYCPSYLPPFDEDLSNLDSLQFFHLECSSDKSGNRIFRIVGKYFAAPVISAQRLKKYVFTKFSRRCHKAHSALCTCTVLCKRRTTLQE